MSTSFRAGLRRLASPQTAVLAVLVVVALVLRWSLFDVVSGDYRSFLSNWYAHLASSGGFAGLADEFSNYNTPYLALLAALTYLPIDPLVAIKTISVLFDLVLAFFAYRIVRVVRPESAWLPTILTGVVLFLPTVVMNGSAWAQCDSIYGSMILASLYFLITGRPWMATLCFGIALAFKLQAVFFLPVLVLVLILNGLKLRTLLAAPVAFFAMLMPALIAGRSLLSQLAVYPAQISGGSGTDRHGLGDPARAALRAPAAGGPGGSPSGGGVGTGHAFTYNAPTPYAWLSDARRTARVGSRTAWPNRPPAPPPTARTTKPERHAAPLGSRACCCSASRSPTCPGHWAGWRAPSVLPVVTSRRSRSSRSGTTARRSTTCCSR